MRKNKRILCLFLTFILLIQQAGIVEAKDNNNVKRTALETIEVVNPLYENIESIEESKEAGRLESYATDTLDGDFQAEDKHYLTSDEDVAAVIREAMVNRKPSATVLYSNTTGYNRDDIYKWMDLVFSETDNSEEGDYLRWNYKRYSWGGNYFQRNGYYYFEFKVTLEYYTTAEQEAELNAEINRVLDTLGVRNSGYTTYEKIKIVYDYLCDNITYDYANLNDDTYLMKYTAYAALMHKTAVCQGYATLMYRMLEEIDIDTRVISGTSNGGAHGWNMSRIGRTYYLLDATWDAGKANYKYFLKGSNNFENHTVDLEKCDFYSSYQLSATDYVPPSDTEEHTHEFEVCAVLDSTCTKSGYEEYACIICWDENVTYRKELAPLGHTYGDWQVIKAVSCTEKGEEYRVCANCEALERKILEAKGHDWNEEPTIDKAATCIEKGSQSIHCKNCDATKDTVELAPLGHTYDQKEMCVRCEIEKPYANIGFVESERTESYTGEAIEMDISNIKCDGPATGETTVTYNIDEKCAIRTYEGTEAEGTAPSEPGKYYVKATVEADENFRKTTTQDAFILKIRPRKVSSATVENVKYGIKITWEERPEADGYHIYRREKGTPSSKYELIASVNAGDVLNYTDKDASQSVGYLYTIRSYAEAFDGTKVESLMMNSAKKIVRNAISSIVNQDGSIKIKWTTIAGADGYKIYRKSSGEDTYRRIQTITNGKISSYTDKSSRAIKNGKASYYYVKPYYDGEDDGYVLATDKKTKYYMSRSTISSVTGASKAFTVKWKQNSSATGYEIMYSRSSSFDDYEKVDISSGTTVSKKVSGLKAGKKYYVKVRAYKKYSGIKHYSAWSGYKSVKMGT